MMISTSKRPKLPKLPYRGLRAPATDPCQPCPACGGLECLCRPRFFAGQLLTEEDLNRLDRYITAKHRLHNRDVHGWGVACGLDVVCDPCDGSVLVHPGHAIDGCGRDIIVCKDHSEDVCKLIEACCSPEPDECGRPRARASECDDLEQPWVLAICYEETPSRGVAALRSSTEAPCCSRCACGGSSSCGCSCHEKSGSSSGARSTRRTPQQCEPTVVCEGYSFKVYPPPKRDRKREQMGAMIERFLSLWTAMEDFPTVPPATASLNDVQQWCCDVREFLLAMWAANPGVNCEVLDRIHDVCPPPAQGETASQYFYRVMVELVGIAAEFVMAGICSVLLPPCPDAAADPCVPLATIWVRRGDCAILRICNLTNRKFLTSFPNLQYWLSWLPYTRLLRQRLEKACCRAARKLPELAQVAELKVRPLEAARVRKKAAYVKAAPEQSGDAVKSILEAFTRTEGPGALSALTLDAFGLADLEGRPFVSETQAANPLGAILADEFVAPLIKSALPAGAASMFARAAGAEALRLVQENERRDKEAEALRAHVDELRETVSQQKVMIDGLRRRMDTPE